ncbi:hypothetical protein [Pedobacter metabolipauper]|uniref:Uncharacterized protein n=1 Tax=Pedobacter metabolipauper TaxID=425513 RepID=A0A4R6SXP4_9SPHI|nr:hypothetical protein [Pedobacter metabolipauper]TDQ09434.1 hypothetical protein ATK78_1588 [Pedobacter metabolipauper]
MKKFYFLLLLLSVSMGSFAQNAGDSTKKEGPELNLKGNGLNINMEEFSKKALQKTGEFSNYLQIITAVNTTRERAAKSIDMACGLFSTEESRVEVSNTKTTVKNKYKIRDYLTRLQFKTGQYDKIVIEYADINYASDFKKGTDGNYYAIVTFVQKFMGFVDGTVVYGDITKRNLTIVVKAYEKVVDGQAQQGWDVFLADMGVVETKKLK